jgi:mannose/fructose-specific phosphotransferase system component IIA
LCFEATYELLEVEVIRIFIASHGSLASGIKSSLNILLGKSENVTVFDAFLDERNLKDVLLNYFASISSEDQVIMVSDLYGGSVNQTMFLLLSRPNTFLVAGMNLSLVLDLALRTDPITIDELNSIVMQSREALQVVENNSIKTKEEDFFEGSND